MTGKRRGAKAHSDHTRRLLQVVLQHYPDLQIDSAASASGQFNDVLIVNDAIVFRFPRTDDAAASLATEVAILNGLRDRLPLPIPNPMFDTTSDVGPRERFIGYRLIPGRPLDRETLDSLWTTDRVTFGRIGAQIGEFLRTLHAVDIAEFEPGLPLADDYQHWSAMREAFRDELFVYMCEDARREVERAFETHLETGADWQPVLRHGDFGGGNVLYDADAGQLSGVIDFGSVALGDPAVDLAAITACDPRLAWAMQPQHPNLFNSGTQRRAAFYRSTFALQQALWALRAGDDDEFNDGIAD